MERSGITILPKTAFGRTLAGKFSSLAFEEYKDLIVSSDTKWGVCISPTLSRVEAFVDVEPDRMHYSIYRACINGTIDNLIDIELKTKFQGYNIVLFDSEGKNTTFGLYLLTEDRRAFAKMVFKDLVDFGYCLVWSPKELYHQVLPSDIPYLLLACLEKDRYDSFFETYAVFNESSLNFLLSNVDPIFIDIFKDIPIISRLPSMDNLTKLTKEWEKCKTPS